MKEKTKFKEYLPEFPFRTGRKNLIVSANDKYFHVATTSGIESAIKEWESIRPPLTDDNKKLIFDVFQTLDIEDIQQKFFSTYTPDRIRQWKWEDLLSRAIKIKAEPKQGGADDTHTPAGTQESNKPSTAIEKAYQSCCWAERQSGKTTDKEVFAYLERNPFEGYEPPRFITWKTYVSRGRKVYNTKKNTPRGGRSVRAAKASDDPGLLKEVSNQYHKVD